MSGRRLYQLWKCLDVGGEEFLEGAVTENEVDDGMLGPKTFEDFFRGGILSGLCLLRLVADMEFLEKYGAHLSGTGEQEFLTGKFIDLLFQFLHARAELVAGLVQCLFVDAHAMLFHACEHGHEWHFDFLEDGCHARFLHLVFQRFHEAECDVGIFTCIVADVFRRQVAHVLLSLPGFAYQFFDVYGAIVEIGFGKDVEIVVKFGLDDVVCEHGVKKWTIYVNAIF